MGAGEFEEIRGRLPEMQSTLRELGLDGWLLFDHHARNAVAEGLLRVGDLTRRYFVLIPADGEPVAVTHGIEQGPWEAWPWKKEVYVAWRKLDELLRPLLAGKRVAMEFSPRSAVPALDLIPAGAVELVRDAGAEPVSSGELITRFYSRWSADGLASHRRAAAILAQVAEASFRRLAHSVAAGDSVSEAELRGWVFADLEQRGCSVGMDCIAANGANAANPHYEPAETASAAFRRGDVVLLDLWSKETEDSVYADQTWMAYLGDAVPARVAELFAAIRDGRDAAVEFLEQSWRDGRPVTGGEVDDVCRQVVRSRGYAEHFIHRTGHSIDRATHGMGPNIDNLETNETRRLIEGVGFSVEPGIYIRGEVGMRTEINVYMGANGPEVTTPKPQHEIEALL